MSENHPELQGAEQALRAGQWAEAQAGFEAVLAQAPECAPAWHGLGVVLARQGTSKAAIDALHKALALAGDTAMLHNHLANVWVALEQTEQARTHYQRAIALDPKLAEAHNNLGNIYYREQHWPEAIACYEQALDLQPEYLDALHNLGQCYIHQQKWTQAIEHLSMICDAPRHPLGAARSLGLAFYFSHQPEQAIPHFAAVLNQQPDDVAVLNYMANCYLFLKDWPNAREYFERVLVMTPDDPQVSYNLGVITTQQTHYDAAINYYQATLALQPTHWAAHHNLANVYLALKQTEQARRHFQKILQHDPSNALIQFQWAALNGEERPEAPPDAYVQMLFDQYADRYDESLQAELSYQAPEHLWQAVATVLDSQQTSIESLKQQRILDLGCGTGLTGVRFKPYAAALIGVDLSAQMVALAEQKAVYTQTHQGHWQSLIKSFGAEFDWVLAGDMLPYVGALQALFSAVRGWLKKAGLFAFTVEHAPAGEFHLTLTGRYTHSAAYIRTCAAQAELSVLYAEQAELRTQAGEPVIGGIYVLSPS